MSGGRYDYLYRQVRDMADQIATDDPSARGLLREAFRLHLELVADAMHAIEWVDSGDWGAGDEVKAIEACLKPEHVIAVLLLRADRCAETTLQLVELAKSMVGKQAPDGC